MEYLKNYENQKYHLADEIEIIIRIECYIVKNLIWHR